MNDDTFFRNTAYQTSASDFHVYLTPPNFSNANVMKTLAGVRPMHNVAPELSFEVKNNKMNKPIVLVHNYGHGGSGWTYAPGSLFISVKNAEAGLKQAKLNFDTKQPVAIVGAGINGLMLAAHYSKLGHPVTIYATHFSPNTTSDVAAGLFAPVSLPKSSTKQQLFEELEKISYVEYKKLADNPSEEFRSVKRMDLYTINTDAELGTLVKAGLMPKPRKVTVHFSSFDKGQQALLYDTYYINTAEFMKEITAVCQKHGVKFVQRTLQNKEEMLELGTSLVFHCSGLGAKVLNQDQRMVPVQGQLVRFYNDRAIDYMVYVKHHNGRYTYWIPSSNYCSLGGTFTEHVDSLQTDEKTLNEIVTYATDFMSGTLQSKL